ncbi:MAG: PLP-dependent aminotransferase family protein [Arenibacterium sp.]
MDKERPAFARWMGQTNDVTRMFLAAGEIPGLINLAGGLPDPSLYPSEALASLSEQVLKDNPAEALNYAPIEGTGALRDLIAARFSRPGFSLSRDNVLITSGGMQALDLVGKVLLDEGDLIAAQTPTYLGALDAWRPRGPRIRPLRPEANGFDPTADLMGCKFAYTVPNFSNPTGRLIPLPVRETMIRAAQETGTWLVEDDPYGTLYYDGEQLPRILDLTADGPGPVIYLGTLSKELAPGLRIGWVVAAPEMISALTLAKQGSDMSTSGLSQMLTLRALEEGLDKQILPDVLSLYRSRRDALCAAMDEHLSGWFDWVVPVGGMFVWAVARHPDHDTDRLLQVALEHKVCVTPSSVFDPEGKNRRAVRINFTLNDAEKLGEGAKRLAAACAEAWGNG